MDAYSMCATSPGSRAASRIYQDLFAFRRHSSRFINRIRATETLPSMAKVLEDAKPVVKPHIAVIGAGVSGLRCADVLLNEGFRVTVIEARNRVGGRLCQEKLPNGHYVDMGPNWIHGTEENPMLDLAKQTDTAVWTEEGEPFMFNEQGELFPTQDADSYGELMWEIIYDAFKYSNQFQSVIPADKSLLDFFHEEIPKRIPETEDGYEQKRAILFQASRLWGAFVGSPIEMQSLKFFWLEECVEGENLFVSGTYRKVLETIAQPTVERAELLLNAKAKKVIYKDEPEDKVVIELDSGSVLRFDHVVVTTPLGWLKQNLDAFQPELPSRMVKGIKSLGYGCLEKVYLSFPRAYWQEGEHKISGFAQWLSPNYANTTNPERWNQEIVDLAAFDEESSHPTLLFYIFGDESRYITGTLKTLDNQKSRDDFLNEFFKPYYSRLPNYSASDVSCQPNVFIATDWVQDELSGNGSYTNFPVGLEEGDEDVKSIRQGIPEKGLWFAGEHTAPFVGLGTVTGAYWSGENVARRIIEATEP